MSGGTSTRALPQNVEEGEVVSQKSKQKLLRLNRYYKEEEKEEKERKRKEKARSLESSEDGMD